MKKLTLIFTTCMLVISIQAQQFIKTGKITYERKVNMWANIKGEFAEQFRKSIPQFKIDLFNLEFSDQQSLYSPASEIKQTFFDAPAASNIVYSNFKSNSSTSMKNVFEKTFLISDSLRDFKWKIKDDFREIAGFNCRRATTILFDSVFVVAFYTDELVTPGGPEGFHGLPGTILGLVINSLHTTWYATKVEIDGIDTRKIAAPIKGTKVNVSELQKQLESSLSKWGNNAQRIQWAVLI